MAAASGSETSDSFAGKFSSCIVLRIPVAIWMGGGSESEHRPAYSDRWNKYALGRKYCIVRTIFGYYIVAFCSGRYTHI